MKNMEGLNEIDVEWISDRKREKRNNPRYKLHKNLVSVMFRKITANSIGMKEHVGKMVVGYTKAVMIASSNEHTIFYAHPCFQNQQRYDWALVGPRGAHCTASTSTAGRLRDGYFGQI